MTNTWTAEELEQLPTLCVSQADDLKIDSEDSRGRFRVWLCRVTNRVEVERFEEGQWALSRD